MPLQIKNFSHVKDTRFDSTIHSVNSIYDLKQSNSNEGPTGKWNFKKRFVKDSDSTKVAGSISTTKRDILD